MGSEEISHGYVLITFHNLVAQMPDRKKKGKINFGSQFWRFWSIVVRRAWQTREVPRDGSRSRVKGILVPSSSSLLSLFHPDLQSMGWGHLASGRTSLP